MTLKVSKRGQVPPFIVMDVVRAAEERERAGETVCHLEVGQPATSAPKGVLAAAERALHADKLGYTGSLGLWPLRQRIAAHYAETYAVEVDPEDIVVTTGSSGGFVLGFLAAFDPGDRVALASPGYPAYRNILSGLGVEVVDVQATPETNFQPTPALLDAVDGPLDGLIVASPSNPTGTMVHREELAALVDYCRERGIRLISDEVYHGITYGEAASTVLSFTRDALVINSFSKFFSMTGWRIGWMVVPKDLHRAIECLAQNLFISPPTHSQYAAVAAFDCGEELRANVARYAENREILLRELPRAGFRRLASAEGAFYIYADVGDLTDDSQAFCARMLDEAGVAVTPGIDFDPVRGTRYVRFSFAGDPDEITEAARRLVEWRSGAEPDKA